MDNCFNFYLDYLLECIVDPDFPEILRKDPRARQHYDYAIQKIEIDELARWRYGPANRLITQKLECIAKPGVVRTVYSSSKLPEKHSQDSAFPRVLYEVLRGNGLIWLLSTIQSHALAYRETYTKSDAWKRAIPGFITALERLPGCSVQPRESGQSGQKARNRRYSNDLADEDFEGTARDCAACTRKHSRCAMQIVLKGRLGDPGYIKGTK